MYVVFHIRHDTHTHTHIPTHPPIPTHSSHTHTVIVIGIRETEISVTEDTGVVEVCAVVLSGDLERDVPFTLTSADGTAIGELVIL